MTGFMLILDFAEKILQFFDNSDFWVQGDTLFSNNWLESNFRIMIYEKEMMIMFEIGHN